MLKSNDRINMIMKESFYKQESVNWSGSSPIIVVKVMIIKTKKAEIQFSFLIFPNILNSVPNKIVIYTKCTNLNNL